MALLEDTIRDLCTRSRLGDQVATATIAVVADRAKKGDKAAEQRRQQILKWCKDNPQKFTPTLSFFGMEKPAVEEVTRDARALRCGLHTGQLNPTGLAMLVLGLGTYALGILVRGPSLARDEQGPNDVIEAAREALANDEARAAFDVGNRMTNRPEELKRALETMSEPTKRACQLGILLGRARRLQAVAHPAVPLSVLCHDIAWELGE